MQLQKLQCKTVTSRVQPLCVLDGYPPQAVEDHCINIANWLKSGIILLVSNLAISRLSVCCGVIMGVPC